MSGCVFPPHSAGHAEGAVRGTLISAKVLAVIVLVLAILTWGNMNPVVAFAWQTAFQIALVTFAVWRLIIIAASFVKLPKDEEPPQWPRYTVMAALYKEANMIDQLVDNFEKFDYPRDQLEIFLLLEENDPETVQAARNRRLPDWIKIVVVPAGSPQTKPRALNYGLSMATGELLTIYDAEDAPHPYQLKESASRFYSGPASLTCLQAPLRIRRNNKAAVSTPILDHQFAAEYAGLFEVILPGMARLGLPFPLGGTSNHFRTDRLRQVQGWDIYNVTEDADLGFRLWRMGWTQDVIASPTYETPPGDLKLWLPQRTRWIKGHLQTLAVHLFQPRMGFAGNLSIITTIMAGIVMSCIHPYAFASLIAASFLIAMSAEWPSANFALSGVIVIGFTAAWLTCWIGSRKIGLRYGLKDMGLAVFYWGLLGLGFYHALWRLVTQPHAWDKTPHMPDVPVPDMHSPITAPSYSSANAGREAA